MTNVDVFLSHYGVKGMKWGVRKDLDSSEIKFNKGDKLFTITNSKEDQKNRSVYTSFTPRDRDNYKGDLASSRALNGPVFEKTFTLDRPLKIASEKKSFEAFQKIYQKDPERLLRDLAESKHERDLIAAAARKLTGVDRSDKYYRSLAKKGENFVQKKGYDLFITNLGTKHSATHLSTELFHRTYSPRLWWNPGQERYQELWLSETITDIQWVKIFG